MAISVLAGKNVNFYLSDSMTSSTIHNTHTYNSYKHIKKLLIFEENFYGIIYTPEKYVNVVSYKKEKTEIFFKNLNTILNLDLETINYKKLFNDFLNFVDKNFKIAVMRKIVYSQGEDYNTKLPYNNLYFSELSLEEKNNINLFSNLYLLLNKLGINKKIYNFKFLRESKKCIYLNDYYFNDFISLNLEKINLLTTEKGNVIDKFVKNTKFCDINNNFINIFCDFQSFIGLDEYMTNISAKRYKEITKEQHEKIEKLFIKLNEEAVKHLDSIINNENE